MAGVEARDGARGRGADEEPRKPEAEAKIMEPEGSVQAEEKREDYLDEGRQASGGGPGG